MEQQVEVDQIASDPRVRNVAARGIVNLDEDMVAQLSYGDGITPTPSFAEAARVYYENVTGSGPRHSGVTAVAYPDSPARAILKVRSVLLAGAGGADAD